MKNLGVYLSFSGNCEEALNFYKDALNGEIVSMQRMDKMPEGVPDSAKNNIMHSEFRAGDIYFMASDSMPGQPVRFGNNITLNINLSDTKEQDQIFSKLSAGGKVNMPLEDTFWGARFGMLTDKFGNNWMLNCEKK
jgi:PhnB protein